jgi:hypothetical protein
MVSQRPLSNRPTEQAGRRVRTVLLSPVLRGRQLGLLRDVARLRYAYPRAGQGLE